MNRFLAFPFILIVLLTSCKKDPLPESSEAEVTFVSTVSFAGEDFEFVAGKNEIALDPRLELFQDSIHFNSAYTNPSCPECGPELRMIIHSPDTVAPSFVTDWIAELGAWSYELHSGMEMTESLLGLIVSCGNNFSSGVWSLNGQILNGGVASNSISLEVPEGDYVIDFTNEDPFCTSGGAIPVSFDGSNTPCYGAIDFDANMPFVYTAIPGAGFNPLSTNYTWFIDTVEVNTGADSTLVLTFLPDIDSLCVLIDDPFGCSVTECAILPQTGIDCVTNINIIESVLTDTTISDPSIGAFVEIQFRDGEGNLYTSKNLGQESSQIDLLSIEPYVEPTFGATLFASAVYQVSCSVYDASGSAFPFSGTIHIALALPE